MEDKIVGLITDKKLLNHKSKRKHPERPQRILHILNHLNQKLYTTHPFVDYLQEIDRTATQEQLKLAHKAKYIKHIKNIWPKTSHRSDIMVLDTYFNEHTEQCSKIAVGGVLNAIDKVVQGKWHTGFALVRPPGHHSGGRNTINGFCIFNNVAIAARYLQQKHKKARIAILDWDVHHGDGTQHIFQDNKDILMISIHRHDRGTFYPASQEGHFSNMGTGWALGTKINISLDFVDQKFKEYQFQAPGDNQYTYIFHRIVEPLLKEFQPQFLLVSSGFDAARGDPLGGFTVTPNGYYYMTKKLLQLQIPTLVVLEGGYNLQSISQAAGAVMKALIKQQGFPQNTQISQKHRKYLCKCHQIIHNQIDEMIQAFSKHWACLKTKQLIQYTQKIKSNQKRVFGIIEEKDSSSSSSSEQIQDTFGDQYSQQTQLPQPPKKQKKKSKKQIVQKKVQEEHEQSITSQFYFAAGHLQRFKNFSPNNQKVHKLTHDQEIDFYEKIGDEKMFTPKYFGKQGNYIIIQNLLYQQHNPVVIDIKLSRQSCNQTLSEERREKQKKKQEKSTSQKYGFRISGYTTPTYKQGGIMIQSQDVVKKILGNAVTKDNKQYFCKFLNDLSSALKEIKRKYFGTSIVIIKGQTKSEIRWVDFHYWMQSMDGKCDQNMIEGVNNLKQFIQSIQTEQQQK